MRNLHRALLAGSLGFILACVVAACGGSGAGLLNGNQASALQNQLNRISSALSAGDCSTVRSATRTLAGEVASLPPAVSTSLRTALDSEANQVSTLSVQQCHPVSTTTTTTTTATTPTTPPTTTETTTTPTTTTTATTPTNTTTTPATTPSTPGNTSGGGGLPGGNGGAAGTGNGNGNG